MSAVVVGGRRVLNSESSVWADLATRGAAQSRRAKCHGRANLTVPIQCSCLIVLVQEALAALDRSASPADVTSQQHQPDMAAAATGDGSASKQSLWQYQDDLPSLPVPALEDTMRRFLKSAEVFLSPEELQHTKAVIADFQRTRGPELQAILEDRASDSRNWVRFHEV